MKKRGILIVTLVSAISILLTGCHGRKGMEAFSMPEQFDESKTYNITFWAKNDTNKTQTEIYKKAISDFNAIYPNIHVDLRLYTDYGKIYNDVITNISTGTTPNVCITYPDHIATYMTGDKTVVELDEMMRDPRYGLGGSEVKFDAPTEEEIIPEFLAECKIGDGHYAVPYMRSTEACYVNKTLVEKLGYTLPDILTWDFVWEVSEKAMETDADGNYAVNGQKVMIPFIYKSTDNMMIQSLYQLNAPYSDDNGNIGIFNDSTRDILFTVAEHAKTGAFSTFKISSYPGNFLNAGQCIFAVDSTAGATWMGTDAPLSDIHESKKAHFETAVLPVPQYDTANISMISQGPSICIFNKDDNEEVLASWLFVQYMLSDDVQMAYSETEGYVPVTIKARNNPAYLDYLSREGEDNSLHYDVKIKAAKLLLDNSKNTFVTPVFNGSTSLRDASGQMIEEVTKATRRRIEVDDAFIDKMYDNMKSLYRLDVTRSAAGNATSTEQSELPTESKSLLIILAVVWIFIAGYVLYTYSRNKSC
ncbi:MAG: extracellular solute-binding protein [Lachnospiraceae bacterium]|nr:extracellular solute-binding protein [Lachnospiraceae bacterium]